jgi:peptidoglycan/xylan/chitin deacetylase (PgdA/CDA1 family)
MGWECQLLSPTVKRIALRLLGSRAMTGLKLRRIRDSGRITILNLHRVAPDDRSAYKPLEPDLFEDLLCFVKKHFNILTFAQLSRPTEDSRPRLILSFDDGYADFAEHAAPILARHEVRVNQNVIPACIDSGLPPLNVIAEDFVGKASDSALNRLRLPGFDFDTTRESRQGIGHRLSNFLKNKPIAEQRELGEQLLSQTPDDFEPTPMMSIDQLREVAKVHEIGAHSFEHASLGCETDEYVRADIEACRRWFADKLSMPLSIYAVPNGSYRPSQIRLLRDSGISEILLVDEDFSTGEGGVHKRFTFDSTSPAETRFRATGARRWV